MATWSHFRDIVRISPDLKQVIDTQISFGRLPLGSTIILGGRVIVHEANFTLRLPGYHLVVAADSYDCAGGLLDTSDGVGGPGAAGAPGADGRVKVVLPHPKVEAHGTPGGAGGQGLDGAPATSVILACSEVVAARIRARGGSGGSGGPGGPGGNEVFGCRPGHGPTDPEPMCAVANAARGGDGGRGGAGGSGGRVVVLRTAGPDAVVDASGGPGGGGGPGGLGGRHELPLGTTKREPTGAAGAPGPPGPNGPVEQTRGTQDVLGERLRGVLGGEADAWAAYRLRIAEYLLRTMHEGDAVERAGRALSELDAVLMLVPGHVRAASLRNQLLRNQNILGLSRDADVIPDFPRYEAVYTDYQDIVGSLFDAAQEIGTQEQDAIFAERVLQRELQQVREHRKALQDDLEEARKGLEVNEAVQSEAQRRMSALEASIETRKAELESQTVSFLDIASTVYTVVKSVAGIAVGGIGLMSALGDVVDIGRFIRNTEAVVPTLIGETFKPFAEKKKTNELLGLSDNLFGHLAKAEAGVAHLVNFTKVLQDASRVPTSDPVYNDLLAKAAETAHEVLLASLRSEQATFAVSAAQRRLDASHVIEAEVERQRTGLAPGRAVRVDLALTLVRTAQQHIDELIKYAFLATRALEIYTLPNDQKTVRYDYGFLEPDLEEDAKEGLRGRTIPELLNRYRASWSNFVEMVQFRIAFEDYFLEAEPGHPILPLSITGGGLTSFRTSRVLDLTVNLEDQPRGEYETKIESVHVALVGAKARTGVIRLLLSHSGTYWVRKRDGSAQKFILTNRRTIANAGTRPLQPGSLAGGTQRDAGFWGKGLAATWRLRIEDEEVTENEVDLSELTEVQVWIEYLAFLEPRVLRWAAFVSQTAPIAVRTGQRFEVIVTMENRGEATWKADSGFALGAQSPQDNTVWGLNRVPVPSPVNPGSNVEFRFTATAPQAPGLYTFQWRMLQEHVQWFGDFSPELSISVAPG